MWMTGHRSFARMFYNQRLQDPSLDALSSQLQMYTITIWSVQSTGRSFPAIRLTEKVSEEMKQVGMMKYDVTIKNDIETS